MKIKVRINVKVFYGDGKGNVIGHYVDFTKAYNEQVRIYGRTREAVLSTIQIYKDRNMLSLIQSPTDGGGLR
ncbi:hypothetical protein AALB51_02360 [Lachnospiraceae bacterium 62-26]